MFITGQANSTSTRIVKDPGNVAVTNESIIVVNKTVGQATTINLAKVTNVGWSTAITIIDGKGDAGTNNITIVPSAGETINGAANLVLSTNYGSVTLQSSGGRWIATTGGAVSAAGGITFPVVARTATADGSGTGTIAAAGASQFVSVTSANANNIIVLPAPVVGTTIVLRNGATGYELRTSDPTTIAINGGTGAAAESAIAANSMVWITCTTATTWQGTTLAGVTLAAIEAAAT